MCRLIWGLSRRNLAKSESEKHEVDKSHFLHTSGPRSGVQNSTSATFGEKSQTRTISRREMNFSRNGSGESDDGIFAHPAKSPTTGKEKVVLPFGRYCFTRKTLHRSSEEELNGQLDHSILKRTGGKSKVGSAEVALHRVEVDSIKSVESF